MATLEKIRKRSVLLLVVIAVALLAFIVGDALTNSRNLFGNTSTVAKVGGNKIDIQAYQNKLQELNEQLEQQRRQNPSSPLPDQQQLAQLAIDQLVAEALITEAVDKMGIQVSSDQLRFYMIDNPVNQNLGTLLNQMQQSGIPAANPQQAYQAIFQPQTVGRTEAEMAPFRAQWIALENETRRMIAQYTYTSLLGRTVQANDLDRSRIHNDYSTAITANYAYKMYGDLDPKRYPVSDADKKAVYNETRYRYRVEEPTKTVAFIRVPVTPSTADVNASRQLAAAVASGLAGHNGTVSKEQKKAGVSTEKFTLLAPAITNPAIKAFVESAPADSVLIISNDVKGFEMVKMLSRRQDIDSLTLDVVQAYASIAPRVLARLNAGLSLDSLQTAFPDSAMVGMKGQAIPLYTADGPNTGFNQAYLDSLQKAPGRYVMLEKQGDVAVIGKLVKQGATVPVYTYEVVSYRLRPSSNTLADAQQRLGDFLAANPNAAGFVKNAAAKGFTVNTVDLTQSSPAIPEYEGGATYLPDTRQVVRWVMIDGDPGDVSKIYESSDPYAPNLYAAAVLAEFDDYYPINHRRVAKEVEQTAMRRKAGDAWVKEYSQKGGLAQISAAMGVPVSNTQVHFNPFNRGNVMDAEVLGAIAGTKPGSKVRVMRGADGVYAFEVVGVQKENNPVDEQMLTQQYQGFINPDMVKMLRGKRKVENFIYRFEAAK